MKIINKIVFFIIVSVFFTSYQNPSVFYQSSKSQGVFSEQVSFNRYFRSTSPKLHGVLQKLLTQPEFIELLKKVIKEGKVSIHIKPVSFGNFNAFWNLNRREVIVNANKNPTEEQMACSILFELHNAKRQKQFSSLFKKARQKKITRDNFVREFEQVEHTNAMETIAILKAWVERGIFTQDILSWDISPSFERHFYIQQMTGHSNWIAKEYDRMSSQQLG